MSDETTKPKPTHQMIVVSTNGISMPVVWSASEDPFEGLREGPQELSVVKRDGSCSVFYREHIFYWAVTPFRDLPETVKQQIEEAKAKPSPRDRTH